MAEEAEEAENEQEAEAIEPEGPKGAWLKQFIILAVLVLVGQSIVAYFLVSKQIIPWYFGEEDSVVEGEKVQKEMEEIKRDPIPVDAPIIYDVPEMIVNPQDYHTIRYLNIKMSLAFESPETLDLIQEDPVMEAKLKEVIRRTLNMTSFYDLDEAKERGPLRQKLVTEINASGLLEDGVVSNVYFQRFIAQ